MHPMARRWPGHGPWDEVWFLEVRLDAGRSVWLRYVLGDGPHRRGLSTWAIATLGDRMVADQGRYDLGHLRPDQPIALGDDLWLAADDPARLAPGQVGTGRAAGRAGDADWELVLHVGPRSHRMVSATVERLQIGRTYVPALLDLHVSGEVRVGGEHLVLDRAPAVLGHIWGASNRTTGWAWCHAHLPDEELLFEGLAARIGPLPVLTSIGLWIGSEHLDLSRTRQLLRTRSTIAGDRWSFTARRRGLEVRGEARLPSAPVATVRYLDPGDGQVRHCRNSGLAELRLSVRHLGSTRSFQVDGAAFEVAAMGEPTGPVLLSD